MKLLHLSDTHGQHRGLGKLPAADVLIHSGDITMAGRCAENMRRIPTDTDVLITHRPPLGVLDEANGNDYGCPHILNAVLKRVRPSLHLFGHVHAAHGVCENGGTTFANAALLGEKYLLENQPRVFNI